MKHSLYFLLHTNSEHILFDVCQKIIALTSSPMFKLRFILIVKEIACCKVSVGFYSKSFICGKRQQLSLK